MTFTLNEDECWQAVLSREASLSAAFFYAVRSTGIYCRPSCPSRRPRRTQVQFFFAPNDAEAAGFRACLRCCPREAAAPSEAVTNVCRYIESHLNEPLDLATLSARAGLSPAHFQRTFKQVVGVTPREYAAACRLGQFKSQLKEGEAITSALADAGYGSTSRLYEQSAAQLGMTPTAYKRGGENIFVAYTITPTPLGKMLVAATAKGICAITLGDSADELVAALCQEYPAAQIAQDERERGIWVETLVRHLAGYLSALDLPLDVRATAFQRRVWQELQAIPYGETRSYTQVAEAIGRPTAARAVAQACASNPVALAVPCHRVVRGDGSLSGYRWGISRKQALLAQEKLTRPKES
jgi:AraC family transcriptional regulator of adaptative response/methylated-DNA-[protein]-cysteine methyltransferase